MTRLIDRQGVEREYRNNNWVATGRTYSKELREGIESWIDPELPQPRPTPRRQLPRPQTRPVTRRKEQNQMSHKFPSSQAESFRRYARENIAPQVLEESRKQLSRKRRHDNNDPDPVVNTLRSYAQSAELQESLSKHNKRRAELPHRPDRDLYESDHQLFEQKVNEWANNVVKQVNNKINFTVEPQRGFKSVEPSIAGPMRALYPARLTS
jgi:hypothetical protein